MLRDIVAPVEVFGQGTMVLAVRHEFDTVAEFGEWIGGQPRLHVTSIGYKKAPIANGSHMQLFASP